MTAWYITYIQQAKRHKHYAKSKNITGRKLDSYPQWVKGLSYVEVLWGVNDSLHVDYTFFSFWLFCGIVLMFLIYGSTVSLPKTFFSKWFVSGIVSHLKFTFPDHFPIHVILSWVIFSLKLIFLYRFLVWKFLWRMFYLYNMFHVQCVYLSGIQGSMICVVDRNQILCDVTFSDHIVHPTCMVDGLQLQY